MGLKTYSGSASLVKQLLEQKSAITPIIDFVPQKPSCPVGQPTLLSFPPSSPEAQGISSGHIAAFVTELASCRSLDTHCLLIVRNGCKIFETAFPGYDPNIWNLAHSQSKSITSIAIGMLIDEGKLSPDDCVFDFFPDRADKLSQFSPRGKNLTVKHLLTMTSGVLFNEAGAVTEDDWVSCFLGDAALSDPGKNFFYNSMNSYMLSAIVTQITGQRLSEYLRPRLFEPLGISDFYWETCPKGIEKGGWGLYIRIEDIAKIGQLLMQNGVWEGKQLLSREYVEQATSAQAFPDTELGDYDYGYQIWVGRKNGAFLLNGMFGQNVLCFPRTNTLIAVTSGNNDMFQQSEFFTVADKYFGPNFTPSSPIPDNADDYSLLLRLQSDPNCALLPKRSPILTKLLEQEYREAVRELCLRLNGKKYAPAPDETQTVGLMPLYVQAVQNNYTRGLLSLAFSLNGDILTLVVSENGATHELPVGFFKPLRTELDFSGEPYLISVSGKFTSDEDDNPVLKIRVSFIETSSSRIIKLYPQDDKLHVVWTELPGKAFLCNGLDTVKRHISPHRLIGNLVSRTNSPYLEHKLEHMLTREFDVTPL